MKADMMEARRQPAAAQRLDRRATAAGPSGAADAGASSALSEAARRANAGPHASSLAALKALVAQRACADCDTVRRTMGGGAPVQRAKDGNGALPIQRADDEDGALPLQRAGDEDGGLPRELRAGLEHLSGRDLSGVRVNYDSPRPAQLNAHAVAQGPVIDVGPGKEEHLAHEGWHAVQQMQNRVRPTMDLGGTPVNDDPALEREADVMGARALAAGRAAQLRTTTLAVPVAASGGRAPVQRLVLGDEGQFDTQNDGDIDGVLTELRSMDYRSLRVIRGMLDPDDPKDGGYVKLIDYELETADALGEIDQNGRNGGEGVFTTASIFIDGQLIPRTELQAHPIDGQQYYAHPPGGGTPDERAEDRVSRNDSEVGTLEDAYYKLAEYLPGVISPEPVVRILVAGTAGPCDGCKRRLDRFRADVLALLPAGSLLSIESAYLNATSEVRRGNSDTRYGFQDEQPDHTAGGLPYWKHRYPLARKD
jgi:hypothetical protein